MRPEIFEFFGIPIHGYGLMIVVGFLLLLWVGSHEVRRRGIPDRLSDVAMVVLLCGILGGRVFFYVEHYSTHYADQPFWAFFRIWEGGLVFYGGAIGGIVGALVFLWRARLPIADYMDLAALLSPLGMAFGRLGCFLNGCCFGRRCAVDHPLGVVFPESSPVALHQVERGWIEAGQAPLPVHPTQLYQAGHDFLLFAGFWLLYRYAPPPRGAGMPLALLFYAVGRFAIEGLRADNPPTATGLTISQNVSVLLFVVGGALLTGLLLRRPLAGGGGAAPAVTSPEAGGSGVSAG